jgi:AcrR family transcriptional regulator
MSLIKAEAWVKVGYTILGTEGIEGIKVEHLARILGLNKSGFYHYFGSMNTYLQNLLRHHIAVAKVVAEDVAACANFDPDLLMVIIKHKTFFLAESQLLVKCRPSQFSSELNEATRIVNKDILPLWRSVTHLPEDITVALAYLNIIHHFFYTRISPDNISYEFLHSLAIETKEVLNKVVDDKHITRISTAGRPSQSTRSF